MKSWIFFLHFTPGEDSTPLETSTAQGRSVRTARTTLSAVSPPARNHLGQLHILQRTPVKGLSRTGLIVVQQKMLARKFCMFTQAGCPRHRARMAGRRSTADHSEPSCPCHCTQSPGYQSLASSGPTGIGLSRRTHTREYQSAVRFLPKPSGHQQEQILLCLGPRPFQRSRRQLLQRA